MPVKTVVLLCAVAVVVHCERYPRFEFNSSILLDNTFINRRLIGVNDSALMCVTNNTDCCTNPDAGNWTDEKEGAVHQGASGTNRTYVTRGDGVVSLNRIHGGSAGMW